MENKERYILGFSGNLVNRFQKYYWFLSKLVVRKWDLIFLEGDELITKLTTV